MHDGVTNASRESDRRTFQFGPGLGHILMGREALTAVEPLILHHAESVHCGRLAVEVKVKGIQHANRGKNARRRGQVPHFCPGPGGVRPGNPQGPRNHRLHANHRRPADPLLRQGRDQSPGAGHSGRRPAGQVRHEHRRDDLGDLHHRRGDHTGKRQVQHRDRRGPRPRRPGRPRGEHRELARTSAPTSTPTASWAWARSAIR